MTATVSETRPPAGELGVDLLGALPTWTALGQNPRGPSVDREYVPELRWPVSVQTFEHMHNDTQLSGLLRGTTLPVRRYVWGLDPNGARPAIVDAIKRDFNLELIEDAWQTYLTGESLPIARARNRFTWDRHLTDVLKALRFGHYYFEIVGEIGDDDGLWHLVKLAARAPWTIGQIWVEANGDLSAIKQSVGMQAPELEAGRLAPYIFEQDPGDWVGRSMFRSCYREWLLKDQLLRIDVINHRRAGGILISKAPKDATPAEIQALGELAAAAQVGGGGAMPSGAEPVFIRGTGSDVIGSINRHDESMAREFLMMFMALGTSSSGGNRALAGSFLDWFAIAQEAVAIWAKDAFNEHVLKRYVDWNWGPDEDYFPRLSFKRPESANPLDQLASAVNQPAGDPSAVGYQTPDGNVVPVAAVRRGSPGAIVVDGETREQINAAHADWEAQNGGGRAGRRRTARAAAVAPTPAVSLPDRELRREPFPHEVTAAIDYAAVDTAWQNTVDQLVADWQQIRADQIAELTAAIEAAGGDLATLAAMQATAAGGDMIAARLTAMAHTGAMQATAEASAQGVVAAVPADLTALEAELAARATALEQLLASSLSQAAANKAVQITGAALEPADVAAQVGEYLTALTDTYLADQFGGAMSAAQNGGRLATMDENGASHIYASELLDTNTCDPCAEIDGTEFETMDDAAAAYPGGGFVSCDGGPRCRGTLVATYDESAASVT